HGRGLGRERPCLAGSGQAGAVTGAHGRAMAADPLRPQTRDRGLQCDRVRGGQRSGEHVAVTGGAGRALEGRQGLGRRRIQAQRTGGAVVVDARGEGVGAQGHQVSVPAGWGTPSAPTATQASWGPRSHISSHLERGFRRWCRPPRTLTLRYCAPGAPGSWSAPADGQGPRAFVERTTMRRSTSERPHSDRLPLRGRRSRAGAVILAVGALMVALYSVVFILLMAQEGGGHSWATAVYWTITTMSTLGYGDITFESDAGRLFSLWVLLSGVVYMLVLLPFFVLPHVVTPSRDRRRAARTPRKVPPTVHDHVLLVGSDAVTQAFAARAERSGVPAVVVLEDTARAGELHDQGRQVIVGPLDAAATYRSAGASRARLVVSTLSDTANTNVAFTVRQAAARVPIAVTASKPVSVDVLDLAGADRVLELGQVLGREMASRVLGSTG